MGYRGDFSNQKEPDYGFWADPDTMETADAAKLVCGRDPLATYRAMPLYNKTMKVIDIIDRAFLAVNNGEMKADQSALLPIHVMVKPEEFIRWIKASGLEAPTALVAAITSKISERTKVQAELFHCNLTEEKIILVTRTLLLVKPGITVAEVLNHEALGLIPTLDKVPRGNLVKLVTKVLQYAEKSVPAELMKSREFAQE